MPLEPEWRRQLAEIRNLPEIGEEPTAALFFTNIPGESRVVIGNMSTGTQFDLPHDGIVFVFPNKERIYNLVQDLGDCSDFPDSV